jgi:hypothetical protein
VNVSVREVDPFKPQTVTDLREEQDHAALCRSRITGESEDRCNCQPDNENETAQQ